MGNEVNSIQTIMNKEQFDESPLKNVMSYNDYFMNALKTISIMKKNPFMLNLPNLLQTCTIFNNKTNQTNPIKNNQFSMNNEMSYDKKYTLDRLNKVKNPELRAEIERIVLYNEEPSQAFIDMILKKYEKRKDEFEQAWARYQEAKGEKGDLKKIFEKIKTKYANSESDYENSLVHNAQRNYNDAELDVEILLSIASDIAHRVV